MKYLRTSNLTILKTWLVGGQVTALGNYAEGFNSFYDEYIENLLDEKGNFDDKKIYELVFQLITEYDNNPSNGPLQTFIYYNDYYKFKLPSDENLNILAKRIKKQLIKNYQERDIFFN